MFFSGVSDFAFSLPFGMFTGWEGAIVYVAKYKGRILMKGQGRITCFEKEGYLEEILPPIYVLLGRARFNLPRPSRCPMYMSSLTITYKPS